MNASSASVPWRFGEMLILYVSTAIGLTTIAATWWAVSGTTDQLEQVPWVNVGVGGLIVLGTGNCFWLLAGRRAIGARRRLLLDELTAVPALPAAAEEQLANGAGPLPVWGAGMAHYHRPGCQLAVGKATVAASVASHERRGRIPCGMCRP